MIKVEKFQHRISAGFRDIAIFVALGSPGTPEGRLKVKYHDDKERVIDLREQKNKYAKEPYTCDLCNVTILKGNRWLHLKSCKHLEKLNKEDKD